MFVRGPGDGTDDGWFPDPRLPELGQRMVGPWSAGDAEAAAAFKALRYGLGVPEGDVEMPSGNALLVFLLRGERKRGTEKLQRRLPCRHGACRRHRLCRKWAQHAGGCPDSGPQLHPCLHPSTLQRSCSPSS